MKSVSCEGGADVSVGHHVRLSTKLMRTTETREPVQVKMTSSHLSKISRVFMAARETFGVNYEDSPGQAFRSRMALIVCTVSDQIIPEAVLTSKIHAYTLYQSMESAQSKSREAGSCTCDFKTLE